MISTEELYTPNDRNTHTDIEILDEKNHQAIAPSNLVLHSAIPHSEISGFVRGTSRPLRGGILNAEKSEYD